MDSIKIIKKHGSPGGLPVVTAYVDENAPGEAEKKLYLHNISMGTFGHTIDIISNDSTPFSYTTLNKWLKDNGYAQQSQALPVYGTILIGSDPSTLVVPIGIYGGTSTPQANMKTIVTTIVDGVVTYTAGAQYSAVPFGALTDKVIEI